MLVLVASVRLDGRAEADTRQPQPLAGWPFDGVLYALVLLVAVFDVWSFGVRRRILA